MHEAYMRHLEATEAQVRSATSRLLTAQQALQEAARDLERNRKILASSKRLLEQLSVNPPTDL